jgi:hypothetical protein
MADTFNYQQMLDRAFAPLAIAGQTKLELAKGDYYRRQALEDEARRRSEHLSDLGAQREFLAAQEKAREDAADRRDREHYKFLKDQAEEARAEHDAEVEANQNRAENLKKKDERRRLYEATGYDGDPDTGTKDDDKKAVQQGTDRLKKLIQLQGKAIKDAEDLLTTKSPDIKKRVIAQVLDDPASIGVLNAKQRAALINGQGNLEDLQKSLSSKDWSRFTALYSTHLADTLATQKDETAKEVSMRLREHQSKFDALNNAITIAQRTLPTGAVLNAYSDQALAPDAASTQKKVGPADPNAGYVPTAPGKVAPVVPAVTQPASQPSVQSAPGSATDGTPNPFAGYGVVPRAAGAVYAAGKDIVNPLASGASDIYDIASNMGPREAYNNAAVPAWNYLFGGNNNPATPLRYPALPLPNREPALPLPVNRPNPSEAQANGSPQLNQVQLSAGIKAAGSLFGTTDLGYLSKVKAWYIQNSGMPPEQAAQDVDRTIHAAVGGDPQAIRKIQNVMSQARMHVPQDLPGGFGMPLDRPQGPVQLKPEPVYQGPSIGPGY